MCCCHDYDKKEDDLKSESSICKVMNSWTEETNPLESEFVISVKKAEELGETARTLENIDKVVRVQYSKDIVDKMLPVFDVVEKVTWIIIGGLIIVTIFLICNTIKLTIIARKNEIEIMRLVGTSNFVIKLPFVIEGLFLGIFGAIIPIIASIWGYILMYDGLEGYLFTNFIKMIEPFPFTIYLSGILLIVGAFYLFDDEDDVFVKSGYILNPLSSTSEKFFFDENTGYKENLSSMIEFVDVDKNTVSVLRDSFLHYDDDSISFLKKGFIFVSFSIIFDFCNIEFFC